MNPEQIQAEIMRLVRSAQHGRMRPFAMVRELAASLNTSHAMVKRALAELVASRSLVYTYRDPCSFVEAVDEQPL